jgi:hypothetical protein
MKSKSTQFLRRYASHSNISAAPKAKKQKSPQSTLKYMVASASTACQIHPYASERAATGYQNPNRPHIRRRWYLQLWCVIHLLATVKYRFVYKFNDP